MIHFEKFAQCWILTIRLCLQEDVGVDWLDEKLLQRPTPEGDYHIARDRLILSLWAEVEACAISAATPLEGYRDGVGAVAHDRGNTRLSFHGGKHLSHRGIGNRASRPARPSWSSYVHTGLGFYSGFVFFGESLGHGRDVDHIPTVPNIREDVRILLIQDAGDIGD
ncbi:MAG: hypothetical protein WAK56_15570 [Candidatus Sulfotelmatobacter sp.]